METLKLKIAGRDRTDDLAREIQATAENRTDTTLSDLIARERDVLSLRSALSEDDYLLCHIRLLRSRTSVDPSRLSIPSSPTLFGRIVWVIRSFLLRQLRYLLDWSFFHQNTINAQLADELKFEVEARRKQSAEIAKRLRALEKELAVAEEPECEVRQ